MNVISEKEAVKKLMLHDVVALPTETVYGLAGMVNSDLALKKIFSTKSRPFFDPLIVHVNSLAQAQSYAFWDDVSLKLAEAFWPGPLTLVLPKQEVVSDLITSGGGTVALRCPKHETFHKVVGSLAAPVAAPSANIFGRTSPTSAEHVSEEFANNVDVVDGGECEKGIESTVVEYSIEEKKLKILRAGVITRAELETFFKEEGMAVPVEVRDQTNAPGHLKNHYQPTSLLFLVENYDDDTLPPEATNLLNEKSDSQVIQWRLPEDPVLAARYLYRDLREFSKQKQAAYIIISSQKEKDDAWQGILDRLKKAAHHNLTSQKGTWTLS